MPTTWYEQLKFGLFFGIGFTVAASVLAFVVSLLDKS